MADTLDDVLSRAKSWPEQARDELRQLALAIDEELKLGAYQPTPDELAGIQRGLADLKAGRLASFAEVEATFRKYGSE